METHDVDEQEKIGHVKIYRKDTGLIYASRYKKKEALKVLLKSGASVDIQNNSGNTALHLAAFRGYKEIVKLLMNWGGNPCIKNKHEKTAIDEAKTEEIRELLRNRKVLTLERKMLNYVQRNRKILRKEIRKDMLIEKYFLIFGRKPEGL